MLPNVLDFLTRRRQDETLPATEAPSAIPESAVDESQARMAAIRETIDLIETDLAAMIRDVRRASDAVRGGTRATADVLGVIRTQSESLATLAGNATENATHLANATEEFAQSSGEIGRQVRHRKNIPQGARVGLTSASVPPTGGDQQRSRSCAVFQLLGATGLAQSRICRHEQSQARVCALDGLRESRRSGTERPAEIGGFDSRRQVERSS